MSLISYGDRLYKSDYINDDGLGNVFSSYLTRKEESVSLDNIRLIVREEIRNALSDYNEYEKLTKAFDKKLRHLPL